MPFQVSRTTTGKQLPVYSDFRHGRTKEFTVIRRVTGDTKVCQSALLARATSPGGFRALHLGGGGVPPTPSSFYYYGFVPLAAPKAALAVVGLRYVSACRAYEAFSGTVKLLLRPPPPPPPRHPSHEQALIAELSKVCKGAVIEEKVGQIDIVGDYRQPVREYLLGLGF